MARDSPYQGLDPFGERDASFFFGRERDIKLISANALATPSLLLYGPSGVGKTSVLLAGVVPSLRERPSVLVAVCREWSGDPTAPLMEAVAVAARAAGHNARNTDAGFASLLEECATGLGRRIVLVFDQFEDRLAAVVGPDPFVEELADALATSGLPLSVLIAVREESLSRLDRLEGYVPGLFETVYRLDHLDRAAGEAAIRRPLNAWNAEVEPGHTATLEDALVGAVLDEIPSAEDPSRIETAHLQLVMQRVWEVERDRDSCVLRAQTFAELGGAREIVREHVTKALDALDPGERPLASDILDRLVTPSGVRMAQSPADLAVLASAPLDDVQALLNRLSRARVLRPVSRTEGGEAFEVFHPSLADAALAWRTRFVAERRAARERARAQRWLIVAVALAVALALVAGLGLYAWSQRQTARSQAYALTAREQLLGDPGLALALALESVNTNQTTGSLNALRQTLQSSHERAILAGHVGAVNSVSLSADGVLTAGEDGTLRVWNPASGEQLRAFAPRKDEALDASFCPDDGRIAVAAGDGAFLLAGGREIALDQDGATAEAVSCSSKGSMVATAGDDGVARVFDAHGDRYRALGTRGDRLSDVAWSRDGRFLAAAAETGKVTIWTVETGEPWATFRVGSEPTVAFAPDGSRLVTGDSSGRVAFVDTQYWVAEHLRGHVSLVSAVAYSPDGALAASASAGDGVVRVWNAIWGGTEVASFRGHNGGVTDVAFGPDGRTIVTGGEDGTARVWQVPVTAVLHGHTRSVSSVSADRAGERLVTAGRDGGRIRSVRVWDAATGAEIRRLAAPDLDSASISPSGTHVLTIGPGSTLRVWEVRGPAGPISLTGALGAAFAPDGMTIAVAGLGAIRIVGLDGSLRQKLTLPGPPSPLRAVAFSPDGTRLAVATFPKGEIVILDIASGKVLRMAATHEGARSLAFSSDGSRLVSAGTDDSPRVWDAATGELVVELEGLGERVLRASFDPGGTILLTSDEGERIRLRDASTGTELSSFPGIDAAFVPAGDGTLIAIAGQNGNAYVVRCEMCGSPGDLRERARERITRSPAERDRALG